MNTSNRKPRIIVTSGEPAGIGPDLIVQLFQSGHNLSHLTVLIDPGLLLQRAKQLGADIGQPLILDKQSPASDRQDTRPGILPVHLNTETVTGMLNTANAPYLLEMLDSAVSGCLSGDFDAMVTGPIQKSVINDAGVKFSGHTEYIAQQCDNAFPVMLLACPGLRVALVTTHIPLGAVPAAITKERLHQVITTVEKEIRERFGIAQPRIVVCGLNPHAGEDGHLGSEEQTVINPVIAELKTQGMDLVGPLPADTAFRPDLRDSTDVFIAMYHDQGLPVLKTIGFGEAVNITLGLPIIRTSVDHGTALTLAGTGKAKCDSLLAAIEMAEALATTQEHNYS